MESKSLMIGDWVVYQGDTEYTNPVRIEGMDALTCALITEDREDVGFDGIEPIPLTAEILEKNGFVNDFYEEESIADYHTIRLEGYSLKHNIGEIDGYLVTWCNGYLNVTTDFHGCIQKDVSYVHQLQHALRLCGIEKEIEL